MIELLSLLFPSYLHHLPVRSCMAAAKPGASNESVPEQHRTVGTGAARTKRWKRSDAVSEVTSAHILRRALYPARSVGRRTVVSVCRSGLRAEQLICLHESS